jgi:pimeloyl-ACP methyl ester carboxylesterase
MRQVAAQAGVHAVGEALISEVAGQDAWRSSPDDVRRMLTDNGAAMLADLRAYDGPQTDHAALATIDQPVLLVAATDSPPEFREATEAFVDALPNARLSRVGGGHMIDPASPEVIAFLEEILERP